MHVPPLFEDLVLVLAAALPVVFLSQKAGMPAVIGFILTGILIGPSATGLVDATENVQALAEVGVALLLFTIGLEFSLSRLAETRRAVVGAGGLQVLGVVAAVALGALACGYSFPASVALGFVAALSSTAIVVKLLADRGELGAPHGAYTLGILLFQDLSVLPMLLVLPALASTERAGLRVVATLFGAGLAIAAIVFAARTVVPWMLRQILRLRSRELFFGAVVLSCFGTAWLTASLGISLAVGAFVAGLVVSESEYSHQVFADMLPLRDLFSSVFFVSIGMLLDVSYVAAHAGSVALLLAGLVAVKVAIGAGAVLAFVPSTRVALLVGAALGQVGEFSFILAAEARGLGILGAEEFRTVLAASVFTMLLTPASMRVARAAAEAADLPGLLPRSPPHATLPRHHHVVIVGYGFNGRNLAQVLRETSIPYVIVDFGADRVRAAMAEHHPVLYGDATRPSVLEHVHADRAAVVVLAIDDPAATRRIVRLVRQSNAGASVVVRTRYVAEIDELARLGANEVIPEEMETSVELFARVLQCLSVPPNVIAAQVDVVRAEQYAVLRGSAPSAHRIESIYDLFTAATTATHLVRSGSPAIGRALGHLDLRRQTGVTLVAIVRAGSATTNPPDEWELARGDILVVLGDHAQIAAARRLIDAPAAAGD